MIYKRCGRCGRRVPTGQQCPECSKIKRDRYWHKKKGIYKQYHTTQWLQLSKTIMSMYGYADLVERSKGHLVQADVVHHIAPTSDDPSRFYDVSNLIPLSRDTHDIVHRAYRRGGDEKKQMQDMLYKILAEYR